MVLDESTRCNVLVPIATDGDDVTIRLVPLDDATYCDTEWLRQGFFPMSFDEQVCESLIYFTCTLLLLCAFFMQ